MTSLGVTAAFLCVLLSVKLAIGQQSSGKDAQESARGTVVHMLAARLRVQIRVGRRHSIPASTPGSGLEFTPHVRCP